MPQVQILSLGPIRVFIWALGFFIWQSAVINIRTKLSLDAICVLGSAFSFALSPALTACSYPSTSTSGKLPLPSRDHRFCGGRDFCCPRFYPAAVLFSRPVRLWPDFQPEGFFQALKWYQKQDVTLGGRPLPAFRAAQKF